MQNKKLFILIFIAVSFLTIGSALAQDTTTKADIQYPIAELGNCANKDACKNYCDKSENIDACINFAQDNGLMTQEEVVMAKKFIATDNSQKPGECTTKDSCEEYCNDINHIDECLAFAIENNLVPSKELAEAKKIQAAIKRGVKPPACGNKKACDVYCDSPEHIEECMNFAIEAGFMNEQEKADSQKMIAAIKRGVKPPPCKGKEACDEYCGNPNNMEVCMNFAIEAGFMSEQEKADSQKMLVALKKGVKPPNCQGKEECDIYCQQEKHFVECLNFAEAAGFMSPEEAVMARKTGGKGPGNCKGKDECEAFCNNPDNQETCFNFGKEHGLIPEEDLKRMEQGKQQFKQSMEQAPQAVLDCLSAQVGGEMLEKIKSGTVMPPREIGESMRNCYEKMGPPQQGEPGEGGMAPPMGQTGPGGCKTQEACQSYCQTNPQECQNFNPMALPSANFVGGGQGSPAGQTPQQGIVIPNCNSPEECQQMGPSTPCQGENCAYGPPPSGTIEQGQTPPQYQQPPTGEYQQPSQFQQIAPGPATAPSETTPPPTGLNNPNLFLGFILSVFDPLTRPFLYTK